MRHHPKNRTLLVAYPSDMPHRSVGVPFIREFAIGATITKQHLITVQEGLIAVAVDEIIAFAMGDRDEQGLIGGRGAGSSDSGWWTV